MNDDFIKKFVTKMMERKIMKQLIKMLTNNSEHDWRV